MKLTRRKVMTALSPVVIGVVLGGLIIALLPHNLRETAAARPAQLVAVKKIFAAGERPSLRLSTGRKRVSMLGIATAEAAEVQTEVKYDGHTVDVPVQILPGVGSDYTLRLAPAGAIKPGLYAVTAKWGPGANETATQTFAWGVLAINTTQPEYMPGDTVQIQMGVLSSNGHTLCSAPLTLSITDPTGQVQPVAVKKSSVCNGDSYVQSPDYTAEYLPRGPGHYQMKMQLADSEYKMEDGFEVVNSLPFKIERSVPTRLYPPAEYAGSITVTAAADYVGSMREELPQGFVLAGAGQGGAISGGGTTAEWKVNLKAGVAQKFTYSFKAPPQSPAFYRLAPLKLLSPVGQEIYSEPRTWQMAGDTAIAFVKQTVGSGTTSALAMSVSATSTAGNLLVISAGLGSNTANITSITDSAGNTWSLATAATGGSGTRSEIWYAQNASAITSVTINVSSNLNLLVNISEYSGASLVGPPEVSEGQGNAASTTASTPTVVTAQTGDLLIAEASWTLAGAATIPGSPWVNLTDPTPVGNKQISSVYQVAAAAGSFSASWTLPGSIISSSIITAFTEDCKITTFQQLRGGNTICTGTRGGFFWAK